MFWVGVLIGAEAMFNLVLLVALYLAVVDLRDERRARVSGA